MHQFNRTLIKPSVSRQIKVSQSRFTLYCAKFFPFRKYNHTWTDRTKFCWIKKLHVDVTVTGKRVLCN